MVRVSFLHQQTTKNRSSKHLIPLTRIKDAVRSMNNEQLQKLAATSRAAQAELNRRAKKASKKAK